MRLRLPRHDVLLSIDRRPRLAALYTEVEQVRGDSFHADWRITDLIRHAATCGAPDPSVVCSDDGPEFTALEEQVRAALEDEPRKELALVLLDGWDGKGAVPGAGDEEHQEPTGSTAPASRVPAPPASARTLRDDVLDALATGPLRTREIRQAVGVGTEGGPAPGPWTTCSQARGGRSRRPRRTRRVGPHGALRRAR
ncbi:hypothetical protein ACPCK8_32645 [Streptomyces cellulosae]